MYAYIIMIFVVIFYAGNILVGKAINELPPLTMSFFRLLVAFLLLLPIGLRSAWTQRTIFWEHKKPLLVMAFTGICFFNVFLYGALQFTSATKVSIFEAVIPVATVLLSFFLLKERLGGIQWAGILISLAGAVWVVMDGKVLQLASSGWNLGDVIMLGAIIMWAVYSIAVKQHMYLFPHYGAILVMSGISVIVLFPAALIEWYFVGVPSLNLLNVIGLLYLGAFPSVVALVLFNRGVELLGPSRASVFLNFLPVATMVGAYFWLDESISVMQMLGALIVISGVILTTRPSRLKLRGKVDLNKQKCS
ncbi:DMT family transporter [Siminovitchia acidinfaciens]|uniref:DMT family transporter n=1 Tax=Siminovitchia acidinfaciens TaxID=2321395 RepID=A0A429XW81_9BACI|nr:DMT family transporter [Siminovitchia acidinfaciens]RST72596.1 DMT family transporter [Siminovitchia acidinfaciens]